MTLLSDTTPRRIRFFPSKPGRIVLLALIGILTFLFVYGPRTLDVTYTDWLKGGKDLTLHFLGWDFFRHDPWAFPLGKFSSYGYPVGSSTTFTDSITLLAIPFKLFNPILPQKFQYFGLWALFCFAMQGIFGGLLLSCFSKNRFWIFMGAVFFTLSPIMLRPAHNALCGHWIILLSLYLYFKSKDSTIPIYLWILVNVLATLIQPYFTLMTFIIYIGSEIDDALRHGRLLSNIQRIVVLISTLGLCGWAIGLFDLGLSSISNRNQFGYYSMNLNALFNPMGWSSFFKTMPTATPGQTAGFNYLGLGMIFILAVSIGIFIHAGYKRNLEVLHRGEKGQRWGLLFIVCSLLLFSLSNQITFFNHVILTYPLPGKILDLCAVFRSSGRIFWPVYYLIYIFAFQVLFQRFRNKKSQRALTVFLVAMLVVQVADMANSPLLHKKLASRSKVMTYHSPLRSNFWNDAARKYRHIVFLPPKIDGYDTFSFYALKNGMTINTGYFARAPQNHISRYANQLTEDLKKGKLDRNNLYVIKDPTLFHELSVIFQDKPLGHVYRVDNFSVLVAYPFPEKHQTNED